MKLFATILFSVLLIGSALAQSEPEIDALTAMINSWQNLPESWNINNVASACSSFQGLICANNQITLLSLQVGLTGTIPAAIGNLTSMVLLDLSNNDLSGTLPNELGLLTELQAFNLEGNAFTGTIPASVYELNKLKIFNVRDNLLGNGAPLPAEFSKLTNLQYLVLGKNNWSGPIPSNWSVLTNLIQLQLHYNPLKTNLPDWLFTALTKLEDFDALSSQIVGSIPTTIGSAKKLKRFIMNNNNMTGTIPDAIGDATNLVTILVFYNQLSGCLTGRLGELRRLQELHIHYNDFSGGIPRSFSNLINLKSLLMQGNRFSGEIPDGFGNLKNITTLSFAFNNLGGCVPQSFAKLYLDYCDLQHNSDLKCCNSIYLPGACKATFDHSCAFAAWAQYNSTQVINLDATTTPQADAATSSATFVGSSIVLGAVVALAYLVL